MTNFKAIVGLLLAAAAGVLGVASSAGHTGFPPSGALHVKKECSNYTGKAGSFCTVTSSNLKVIAVGSKIVYATPDPGTDTDLTVYSKGAKAFGHVILNPNTGIGKVTFSGGTGRLKRFKANLVVKPIGDPAKTLYWRWDGRYRFGDRNDD